MKFRFLLTMCLAGASLMAMAQTHKEGIEYYKADQFLKSEELLLRNMNNAGTDKALANYYLGRIEYDYKFYDKADKFFNAGIAANPECPFNYVGLGAVQLMKKDVKAAKQQFKLAEKYGKKNSEVMVDIAKAYYEADPVLYAKDMNKYLDKARNLNMSDPAIYIFEGDMFKDKKDVGQAAAMYEMAANYDNQSAAAYVKYAKLFKEVNPDFGIKKLKELLQVNPSSALGQRELALAYYEQNRYKDAADQYGKYVQNPNHFKVDESEYSFLLFYNSEYEKGYQYATDLIAKNPDDFTAKRYQLMNAASMENFDGNIQEMAENLWRDHLTDIKNNRMSKLDYNIIIQYLNVGEKYDDAIAAATEAIEYFPDVNNYKTFLAQALVKKSGYKDAADFLNNALKDIEKPDYNLLQTASRYNFYAGSEMTSNPEEATPYLNEAKSIAAQILDLEKSVRAYKLNGDMNRAILPGEENLSIPFYEEAINVYVQLPEPKQVDKSNVVDAYTKIANYIVNTDKAKALDYVNKALAIDPEFANAKKLLDAINKAK